MKKEDWQDKKKRLEIKRIKPYIAWSIGNTIIRLSEVESIEPETISIDRRTGKVVYILSVIMKSGTKHTNSFDIEPKFKETEVKSMWFFVNKTYNIKKIPYVHQDYFNDIDSLKDASDEYTKLYSVFLGNIRAGIK